MLKHTTFVENLQQVTFAGQLGVTEVILAAEELSRWGRLKQQTVQHLAREALKLDLNVSLHWDRPMDDEQLALAWEQFSRLSQKLAPHCLRPGQLSARVMDLGVLQLLLDQSEGPDVVLELGHLGPNYEVLKVLAAKAPRLVRIAFSLQMDLQCLRDFWPTRPGEVEYEVYAHGPIPILHTPRNLLSPILGEKSARVDSLESHHKELFACETMAGTTLFNAKDLSLLDYLQELKQFAGLWLSSDFRSLHRPSEEVEEAWKKWCQLLIAEEVGEAALEQVKQLYPRKLGKGLFSRNKTDALFPKLSNPHLKRSDDRLYLGEVISVERDQWIAVELKNPDRRLETNHLIKFVKPQGKVVVARVKRLSKLTGALVNSGQVGEVIRIPFVKGVTAKTQVYHH